MAGTSRARTWARCSSARAWAATASSKAASAVRWASCATAAGTLRPRVRPSPSPGASRLEGRAGAAEAPRVAHGSGGGVRSRDTLATRLWAWPVAQTALLEACTAASAARRSSCPTSSRPAAPAVAARAAAPAAATATAAPVASVATASDGAAAVPARCSPATAAAWLGPPAPAGPGAGGAALPVAGPPARGDPRSRVAAWTMSACSSARSSSAAARRARKSAISPPWASILARCA